MQSKRYRDSLTSTNSSNNDITDTHSDTSSLTSEPVDSYIDIDEDEDTLYKKLIGDFPVGLYVWYVFQ